MHATYAPYGWVKGEPLRYIRGHQNRGKGMTEHERRVRHNEQARAYVARHRERRRATQRAAWERLRNDPERYARFLARGRASYARHPETAYIYALNWRATHRERVRANNRGAWARRVERLGSWREVGEIAPALRRDPCAYCGGPGGVVDHIVAVAAGGVHEAENLTGACRRCNARKGTKSLLLFLANRLAVDEMRTQMQAAVRKRSARDSNPESDL